MRTLLLFLTAALLEIGGGYLVCLWLRDHKSPLFGAAGFAALALYGVIPVLQAPEHPFGRVYAGYGAVFIVGFLFWGWAVDKTPPDARGCVGVAICLVGALAMMWPRALR